MCTSVFNICGPLAVMKLISEAVLILRHGYPIRASVKTLEFSFILPETARDRCSLWMRS
jgi:hypothetical protein